MFGGILISAVIIFLLYYTMLPAINLKSQDFIIFLILSTLIILTVNFITYMKEFLSGLGSRGNVRVRQNPLTGQIQFETEEREPDEVTPPPFHGQALKDRLWLHRHPGGPDGSSHGHWYPVLQRQPGTRDLIQMETGDFSADVAEISMNQIPVVDKDTATRLGSRKLGEMTELVSQFEIENNYTQINYNGIPYRVTPLSYADPIKWLYNQKKGLPAYITVNMVTQQTDLVWLENGMKYSPSEYFFRNILPPYPLPLSYKNV